MVLKYGILRHCSIAFLGAMLLATGHASAEPYRPGAFLGLSLNQAALSPQPLGPPAQFEPSQFAPAQTGSAPAGADVMPVVRPGPRRAVRLAHSPIAKPHAIARTKVARARTNPLDAQAADTRVQVWPCRSGGICNWQRGAN